MLDTNQPAASTGSRFDQLFTADPTDQAIWNTVLARTPDYLIVPTLGSIVPNWHLVIPRAQSINMRRHLAAKGERDIRRAIAPLTEALAPKQLLWFEHGPRAPGSVVGCGTDYAHLHVILDAPFSHEAFENAAREFRPSWTKYNTEDAYGEITTDDEYFAFGNLMTAFVSRADGNTTSQLFRKIIANLANKPDQWDYRLFSHEENAHRTVEKWKKL